jgi:CRISPR-associated protein Csy1
LSFDLEDKLNTLINVLDDKLDFDAKETLETQKIKWQKELQETNTKYDYANWLDWAAANAKGISFSTHPIKLTHSSISGASNIYDSVYSKDDKYITTSSLSDKPIDIGSSNNALAPIGKLLELKFNDIELASKLSQNDVLVFEQFAKNEQQLKKWQDGFSESFKNSNPSSHSLAKQIYFPTQADYHLISPLVSSSMTHILFNKVREINFDTEAIEIRKAKHANLYHVKTDISYPNIAIRMVTASQHGNASPLNGKRSGQSHLFSSIPPQWQSQIKPPIKGKSLFKNSEGFVHRYFKENYEQNPIKELKDLLVAIKLNKLSLNLERKRLIQNHINAIVDSLFDYVTQIQNLTEQSGWSQSSELKQSHQFWLDPYRQDDEFQKQRQEINWQNDICQDFSFWLNKQLKHKQLTLGKPQADYWAKIFRPQLREFEAITESK